MKDDLTAKKSEEIAEKILKKERDIFKEPDLQESIRVYEYLQNEFNKKGANITSDYVFQFLFRSYYRLDSAGLTPDLKKRYFELMRDKEQDLNKILSELYRFKILKKKKTVHTIQFSFATKLLHTINDNNPIIDTQVAKLLDLNRGGKAKEEKIESCVRSYGELKQITKELLKKQEIHKVIQRFREKFNTHVSDTKVLDFLLWKLGAIEKRDKK